jgi:hypothetical protein
MAAIEILSRYFPDFSVSRNAAVVRLMKVARILEIPQNQTIFQPGGTCGSNNPPAQPGAFECEPLKAAKRGR